MKKIDGRKHMKKKALLLLPLALMGMASCDVPNQWQNDAQSIYVLMGTDQYGSTRGDSFVETDGRVSTYYAIINISYHLENDAIYVKEAEKRYNKWDYDGEKNAYSNPRDLYYDKTFVHKYVNFPYRITYKEEK